MQTLIELYKATYGHVPHSVHELTKAGSNRTYFRLTNKKGDSVIGCIGTSVEENRRFIYMARHFLAQSLPVPHIINVSNDETTYLQEDLGSQSLFDLIAVGRNAGGNYNAEEVELLKRTIRLLPHFQFRGAEGFDFTRTYQSATFDATSIMFDLNYFKYCFLKLADISFDERALEQDFVELTSSLLTPHLLRENSSLLTPHPSLLYRDFQARNVMIRDGKPYMIDFQGARRGPIFYDVASFLWQASSLFSDELRMKLIDEYLLELHTYTDISHEDFLATLKVFVLFRPLQVLGAYGYRGLWEKKKHFIDSIPPAIANLSQLVNEGVCDDYPELRAIAEQLAENYASIPHSSLLTPHSSLIQNDTTYLATNPTQPLVVRVFSFSYKKGIPIDESGNGGGYVFDCRATHNPGRYEPYKHLTGLDTPVIDFLENDGEVLHQLEAMYSLVDFHVARYKERGFTNLMISCGCTGGQHRSVYCAQHIAEYINNKFGVEVHICHREQNINTILNTLVSTKNSK